MSVYSRDDGRGRCSRNRPSLELHDVGLVDRRDLLAARAARAYSKANSRDPRRRLLGDDLQALDHAGHDLVLEPGVEILGVLADDDQVDVGEAARDARQVPHRPEVGVEVERLAQPDVDAGEAFADRRRDRPLQRDLVALDRVEQRRRQRLAEPLERDHAGVVALPLDVDARRLEDPDDRLGDFRADAVAGDERDGVGHVSLLGLPASCRGREQRRDRFEQLSGRRRRTPPGDRCRCRSRRAPRRRA